MNTVQPQLCDLLRSLPIQVSPGNIYVTQCTKCFDVISISGREDITDICVECWHKDHPRDGRRPLLDVHYWIAPGAGYLCNVKPVGGWIRLPKRLSPVVDRPGYL